MTDVDTLAAAVRLAAIGEQRDPERAITGNHGLLFRDGLAPMLAPNTVKSYGDAPRSPHAMPVTRDTRVTLSVMARSGEVPVSTGPDDLAAAGRGHLRASRADREHVIAVLKTAFVQDRLTRDEFDHQVGQVLVSRTYAELAAITVEIPVVPPAAVPPVHPGSRTLGIAARRSGVCALITVALVEGAALGDFFALLYLAVFSFIATVAFLGYGVVDAREERRSRAQLPPAQDPTHAHPSRSPSSRARVTA